MRNLIRKIRETLNPVVPGLEGSKVLLSVPKNCGEWGPDEWYEEFARKNEAAIERGEDARTAALCPYPGCEGHMLSGPTGGMSENIKCDTCERKWNLMTVIGRMERI